MCATDAGIQCTGPYRSFVMVWGAIIAGAASLYSASQSRKHARSQTRFQADREDDAVSRRMADLKRAGINPILAGSQAAASSAGSQVAPSHDAGQAFASGLSSSAQFNKAQAEVEKIKEEVKSIPVARQLTEEQIVKVSEEIVTLRAQANKLGREAEKLWAEAERIEYENVSGAQRSRFYSDHPILSKIKAVSDSIGIQGRDVLSIVRLVLGRGNIFGNLFGKRRR